MAPRETENNAYAKFWGDKQRTLWYVMVFLEWSIALMEKREKILICEKSVAIQCLCILPNLQDRNLRDKVSLPLL